MVSLLTSFLELWMGFPLPSIYHLDCLLERVYKESLMYVPVYCNQGCIIYINTGGREKVGMGGGIRRIGR